MEKPQIIIIRESVAQSWLRDAGSVTAAVILIGIGVVLGSSAMQWCGFLFFFLWFLGWFFSTVRDSEKTPQEAANWLRDNYGVSAED